MTAPRSKAFAAIPLILVAVVNPATAQQSTFPEPTYGGYSLAYCGVDSSTCGQQVATEWCRTMSYDQASEWGARAAEGKDTRTVRLEDGMMCQGASCESFAFITCERQAGGRFYMPNIGAAGKATLIQSGPRGGLVAYAEVEEQPTAVPGCRELGSGAHSCASTDAYQHCRTLIRSNRVHSCRAELTFDESLGRPVAAAAEDYRVKVESTAAIRVEKDRRGEGRVRGDARIDITFEQPTTGHVTWCDRRDGLLFHTTGPRGGTDDAVGSAGCDEPISVRLAPHEDDVLVAYDMCDAFAAWGSELTHRMDAVVAGLFHLGSGSPGFKSEFGASSIVVAPYAAVEAPVTIDCRD